MFVKKYWYLILEFLFIIIIILSLNYGITILRLICLVLTLIISIFLKREYIVILISFLLPLAEVLRISENSYTVLPFLIIIYIIKYTMSKKQISLYMILLIAILLIINLINSLNRYNSLIISLPMFVYIIFSYFLIKEDKHDDLFNIAGYVFIFSSLFSCIGSEIFVNAAHVIGNYNENSYRFAGMTNITSFGQNILVAFSFLITLFKKNKINIILFFILFIIFGYYIIKSGSRSVILGILLGVIFLVFAERKN